MHKNISIHAPSRERPLCKHQCENDLIFQSTLPRGSDQQAQGAPMSREISIHAPSRERLLASLPTVPNRHFNPRSLAGATIDCLAENAAKLFQSTLPRGSDRRWKKRLSTATISIHAPSRERRLKIMYPCAMQRISIHAPSRERLSLMACSSSMMAISIHAPSRERHTAFFQPCLRYSISIHAPSRERLPA